jgi:hypothetical protein
MQSPHLGDSSFSIRRAFFTTFPELSFALLPLLVVALVVGISQNSITRVLESPEWSFGAVILFGQALVHFSVGVSGRADTNWMSLVITLIVVFGLAPSIAILGLILHHEGGHSLPMILVVFQLTTFVLSIVCFIVFGGMGNLLLHRR